MSDYIAYSSEEELRGHLSDVKELLDDFKKTEEALEEQRGLLADQVQGATAILEKQVRDYEQKRDDLDQRRAELIEQRKPFLGARDRLQQQIDAKQDAKQSKSTAGLEKGNRNENEAMPTQGEASLETNSPATKAQIEKLEKQKKRPKAVLELTPPGGINQATQIDQDLKRMSQLQQKKQQQLDEASQNMRSNWDRSSGPKR